MGIYSEYIDQSQKQQLDLVAERKQQLKRIAELRGRDILVYASDSNKARLGAPVAIDNTDLIPIIDQVSNLKGNAIDVILVTGGGSGEAAEDIVRFLYDKYQSVAFIVPSIAKSAGTIMVMAGDEILMEPSSSLGPIDAQIQWEGKVFSAEAFLKGIQRIKDEASESNSLNRAYIPILQRISPGEIQSAQNALDFAKELVTKWLKEHKFQNWNFHRTHEAGRPVTDEEKEARAKVIADQLCDHSRWLSHGRSIKISDLHDIGLEIIDYTGKNQDGLADAIQRYNVLLQMTFDQTGIYKLIETPDSQINRFSGQIMMPLGGPMQQAPAIVKKQPLPPLGVIPGGAIINFKCPKCQTVHVIQADFDSLKPLQPNMKRFPPNDMLHCEKCNTTHVITVLRKQLEAQTGRKVAQ